MKRSIIFVVVMTGSLCLFSLGAFGQGAARTGPDASTQRDPEIEKDSTHNLDVAWQYFKLRKAYLASLARCEEIIAGNPSFSKIDQVYYLAGVSSLRLAEGKGKQKSPQGADKLRVDAREYLMKVVKDFPDSAFKKDAEVELRGLGDVAEKSKS